MMQFFYGSRAVQTQTSLGSGVIVSEDGLILTNSHVVGSRGAQVHVTTNDNREVAAQIQGIDPYTDLAVLKVDARGLAPLPWGDSSKLRVAEWVLAVGNPFQFNQTVTLGIVSAQNRHDPQLATYNDFIQTDAAINPGNSGGALVNSRGELIGINTMIYSETGGYQGIGFAIPANLARRIMTELVKNGEIVARLGGQPRAVYRHGRPGEARRARRRRRRVGLHDVSRRSGVHGGTPAPRHHRQIQQDDRHRAEPAAAADCRYADRFNRDARDPRRGEHRSIEIPIERAPQAPARR